LKVYKPTVDKVWVQCTTNFTGARLK